MTKAQYIQKAKTDFNKACDVNDDSNWGDEKKWLRQYKNVSRRFHARLYRAQLMT